MAGRQSSSGLSPLRRYAKDLCSLGFDSNYSCLFLERRCIFPPWNWCLLSTTFGPGWMDNGQSVFLEVILPRSKCQPHLLISIHWGSISLSVTGCHVRGWTFVRPDVNDAHMHVARVWSLSRTRAFCWALYLRVAAGDSGNRPRLWQFKSLVPLERLQ